MKPASDSGSSTPAHLLTYPDFVHSRVKWFEDHSINLHHFSTGIVGEVLELERATSRENQLEEIGDVCFYIEHGWLTVEKIVELEGWPTIPRRQVLRLNSNASLAMEFDTLRYHAGQLLDKTKKVWIYKKPVKIDLLIEVADRLNACEFYLTYVANLMGFALPEAIAANHSKLSLRYPDGYTDKAAQARADKKGSDA